MLLDLTSLILEKVYHLATLVPGEYIEKLLGIPKLVARTDAAMADATVSSLIEWGMKEHIVRMCFDTNTQAHIKQHLLSLLS